MRIDLSRYERLGYKIELCKGSLVSMEKSPETSCIKSNVDIYFVCPGVYRVEASISTPDGIIVGRSNEAPLGTLMRRVDRIVYGGIESYFSGARNRAKMPVISIK